MSFSFLDLQNDGIKYRRQANFRLEKRLFYPSVENNLKHEHSFATVRSGPPKNSKSVALSKAPMATSFVPFRWLILLIRLAVRKAQEAAENGPSEKRRSSQMFVRYSSNVHRFVSGLNFEFSTDVDKFR